MKYWYDCEFIEDGKTIDLVSIGIIAEDGREFYAQNAAYDPTKASEWVRQNVFVHLRQCPDYPSLTKINHYNSLFGVLSLKGKIADKGQALCRHEDCVWQSPIRIRNGLLSFCDPEKYGKPEFWGYYSAYDHVALCQLFGRMIDLPKGWPMYTRDLKQWCDQLGNPQLPKQESTEHYALTDARWNRQAWEFLDAIGRPVPITADAVRQVRERASVGLIEAKDALSKTGGDVEKAVASLR